MTTHQEKLQFMREYAKANNVELELETSCGLGRDCVGISAHGQFPDYWWYDSEYNELSGNEDIFIPKDAYHKHACVAVLGHGIKAESQLYDWLKWFYDNNYRVEITPNPAPDGIDELGLLFWNHYNLRMIKNA